MIFFALVGAVSGIIQPVDPCYREPNPLDCRCECTANDGAPGAKGPDGPPGVSLNAGSGNAHNNMMPFIATKYIIALYGIYPSRSARDAEVQMSDPFIGMVELFAGNFAPRGFAFCEGQLLSISDNTALFSILGTTYGGDGRTTFALPDLRGRVPVHPGSGPGLATIRLGEKSGTETETLTTGELPTHSHQS